MNTNSIEALSALSTIELQRRARTLKDEIDELDAIPEADLKAGHADRLERCTELAQRLATVLTARRQEELDRVRKLSANPGNCEYPQGHEPQERSTSFGFVRSRDPWSESVTRSSMTPKVVRDRALSAVEQVDGRDTLTDDARQLVSRLVREEADTPRSDVAEWAVATSRPEYESAFAGYLRGRSDLWTDGERAAVRDVVATQVESESRTAMSTTSANGGYLIPFFLDPTMILTNAGAVNPMRQLSRVETIPTTVWHGVSSAGVSAEWIAEATEFTDASPTFAQPTVTTFKADALLQASWELLEDSNLSSQIGVLFADAKTRLEATAFVTGTGSAQPTGIVTALAATTASRVSASTNGSFGAVDVFALVNSLPARAQDNASFLAHWGVYNLVRQFANTSSNASSQFWVDLGPGQPSTLLGAPAYKSSVMTSSLSAATASSDDLLVLADFRQSYVIVDRIGMNVVNVPSVGSNRRPDGQTWIAAYWRTGGNVVDGGNTGRLLRV